jgi:TPR repeat protein
VWLTPTFKLVTATQPGGIAFAALRLAACACVLLLVMPATSALAADDEEGAGFFQYFPAPPKLELPDIKIPFWTDELKRGRKAYNKGDYSKAFKFFRRASEDGSPVADWYLANMFRLGLGVKRDHAIAHSYYERVANAYEQEELSGRRLRIAVDSQLHLANYLRLGLPDAGIKANPSLAARHYLRIASTYGHPGAQYALGVMNVRGEGLKRNEQQGLKWLTAAAKKRHPDAQAFLGDLYWSGKVVKKSETRALMWYVLARETAHPEEHAQIIARYNELYLGVDEEIRLEAEARARVWAEQYPAGFHEETQ